MKFGFWRYRCLLLLLLVISALLPNYAMALGEKATEPYIRTRTVLWYDVQWSADKIAVNDTITVTGQTRRLDPN